MRTVCPAQFWEAANLYPTGVCMLFTKRKTKTFYFGTMRTLVGWAGCSVLMLLFCAGLAVGAGIEQGQSIRGNTQDLMAETAPPQQNEGLRVETVEPGTGDQDSEALRRCLGSPGSGAPSSVCPWSSDGFF